jgi:hypothetical protein
MIQKENNVSMKSTFKHLGSKSSMTKLRDMVGEGHVQRSDVTIAEKPRLSPTTAVFLAGNHNWMLDLCSLSSSRRPYYLLVFAHLTRLS